eukprot:4066504-Amphidinium_carterae.1
MRYALVTDQASHNHRYLVPGLKSSRPSSKSSQHQRKPGGCRGSSAKEPSSNDSDGVSMQPDESSKRLQSGANLVSSLTELSR